MNRLVLKAFIAAVAFHAFIFLFGGLLFFRPGGEKAATEEIDLLGETAETREKPEKKADAKPAEEAAKASDAASELDDAREAPPDLGVLDQLQAPVQVASLDAVSLAELESALNPALGGAVDAVIGGSFSLASGGRIGGTGSGGTASLAEDLGAVVGVDDLDRSPRAIVQTAPQYPPELRKRKVTGTVEVTFLVEESGRVTQPRVERATEPGFERAALDAVRQWRFEPGTRGGKRVSFKMRIPISFRIDA